VDKCQQLGFPATKETIYGTATVIAKYLKSHNFDKKVYCIGSCGLKDELDNEGISHIGIGPDVSYTDSHLEMAEHVTFDPDVTAVVCNIISHYLITYFNYR
jgi:ribonucleotide monophosphatase NagD (HAD superfamily)